jgi:hypothetical protein
MSKIKATSGFVYIWYDRKHKRFYIGCHWGNENDSYICSSRWMRKSYRRRPDDFKRRIIARVSSSRSDLFEEEHKWMSLISKKELGKKYYNLRQHKWGHWTSDEVTKDSIAKKISESHNNDPNWGSWGKGKILSDETKDKIRQANHKQFENEDQRELRRIKSKELWQDEEYRAKQKNKGKTYSQEGLLKRKQLRKPIVIHGILYPSAKDASNILNKSIKYCRYHGIYL